jgi:hypothetical protein
MRLASWRAGQRFSSSPRRQQLLQQAQLVVGVEDGEIGLQADELGVAAQQLDADGMEGAEPGHALHGAADEGADAVLHLARRLVGEGDDEDLRRPGLAGGEHMGKRVVSTRVLPVPAPASTSSGPSRVSTAWRCSGLRAASQGAGAAAMPRARRCRGPGPAEPAARAARRRNRPDRWV